VLDEVKIEKLKRDPALKSVRKRRTIMTNNRYGGTYVTQDVDLAAGGIYVEETVQTSYGAYRRRRRRYEDRMFKIGETSVSERHLNLVLATSVQLGILDNDMKILIKTENDTLGDNWAWLQDKVTKPLRKKVSSRRLTGLYQKSVYDLGNDLRALGTKWNFDRAPEDLRQLKADTTKLYNKLQNKDTQGNTSSNTDSDKAFAALKAMNQEVKIKEEITDPITMLSARYEEIEKKYPFLHYIVSKFQYESLRQPENSEAQRQFDHYFELLAAKSELDRRNEPELPLVENEVDEVAPLSAFKEAA
jgi:hypothetical protein